MPALFSDAMRQVGTYQTAWFDVPVAAVGLRVSIDRARLTNVKKDFPDNQNRRNEVAQIDLDISQDGGATFVHGGGFGIEGGDLVSSWRGAPVIAAESTMRVSLEGPGNPNRMIRGNYTILERLRASVVAEWTY